MAMHLSIPADVLHEAQRLYFLILNATSAAEILDCINGVEVFVRRLSVELMRHFYTICFPALLSRIFGLDDVSSNGWISHESSRVTSVIVDFLSPSGLLFSSMSDADVRNLVHYVFPWEHLPGWIQKLFVCNNGFYALTEFAPALFKNKLKEGQLQLNIFEYYMFWFAYYAVSQEKNKNATGYVDSQSPLPTFQGMCNKGSFGKQNPSPYLSLVDGYLQKFLLSNNANPVSSGDTSHNEFLYHTFIQFWCVDNDPLPVPLRLLQNFGVLYPFQNVCQGFVPINIYHAESVRMLVNHVNSTLYVCANESCYGAVLPSYSTLKACPASASDLDGFNILSLSLQKPFYRFILRALVFWPVGASVKDAINVIDVWLDYLQPWKNESLNGKLPCIERNYYFDPENKSLGDASVTLQELPKKLPINLDCKRKRNATWLLKSTLQPSRRSPDYDRKWQSFILANFPFYCSLILHFIFFTLKFVHMDAKTILEMTQKVLTFLASSKELRNLLQRVESAYHDTKSRNVADCFDSVQRALPIIQKQLQDWEDDITAEIEKDYSTNFLSRSRNSSLQLFGNSSNGGRTMLKLLILQAEALLQCNPGDKMFANPELLDELKSLIDNVFGEHEADSHLSLPSTSHSHLDNFLRQPGIRRHSWEDVKYKGDWMKRPIENSEIAWLARFLVWVSDGLNNLLGLAYDSEHLHGNCPIKESRSAWPQAQTETPSVVYKSDWQYGRGLLWCIFINAMRYCLNVLLLIQKLFRKKGWRINLRFLAQKKVLILIVMCTIAIKLIKGITSYFCFLLAYLRMMMIFRESLGFCLMFFSCGCMFSFSFLRCNFSFKGKSLKIVLQDQVWRGGHLLLGREDD